MAVYGSMGAVMEITAPHRVSFQKPQGSEFLFPGTSPVSLCSILAQNRAVQECWNLTRQPLFLMKAFPASWVHRDCSLVVYLPTLLVCYYRFPSLLKRYFPFICKDKLWILLFGGNISFSLCLCMAQLLSWMHSETVESAGVMYGVMAAIGVQGRN